MASVLMALISQYITVTTSHSPRSALSEEARQNNFCVLTLTQYSAWCLESAQQMLVEQIIKILHC